jgi:hypothetical protein
MPAQASNWSRYPALLSLALLPIAAGTGILAGRERGKKRALLLAAAGLAALGTILAHTRMMFVLAALFLAAIAARRLRALAAQRGAGVRWIALAGLVIAIGLAALVSSTPLQRDAAWVALAKLVQDQGSLSTLLALCLAPFALRRHPTATVATVSWGASILLLLFLPPNASYPLPILDVPIVRMAAYLPLSALGGLGVAGVWSALASPALRPSVARGLRLGAVGAGTLVVGWALRWQSNAPSDCCLIAGEDDISIAEEAASWLSPEARILIPSEAQVNYSPAPVEGGAWLSPLTGLVTVLWPADAELSSPAEHRHLCDAGITHVYVGGTVLSYRREDLELAPDFYSRMLSLPNAALYQVEGCDLLSSPGHVRGGPVAGRETGEAADMP